MGRVWRVSTAARPPCVGVSRRSGLSIGTWLQVQQATERKARLVKWCGWAEPAPPSLLSRSEPSSEGLRLAYLEQRLIRNRRALWVRRCKKVSVTLEPQKKPRFPGAPEILRAPKRQAPKHLPRAETPRNPKSEIRDPEFSILPEAKAKKSAQKSPNKTNTLMATKAGARTLTLLIPELHDALPQGHGVWVQLLRRGFAEFEFGGLGFRSLGFRMV